VATQTKVLFLSSYEREKHGAENVAENMDEPPHEKASHDFLDLVLCQALQWALFVCGGVESQVILP
jgi:hypothetical protein